MAFNFWKEAMKLKLKSKAVVDNNPAPTFTLNANDTHAPTLVRAWADHYFQAKGGRGMLDSEHDVYLTAHEIAIAMERWHRERNKR